MATRSKNSTVNQEAPRAPAKGVKGHAPAEAAKASTSSLNRTRTPTPRPPTTTTGKVKITKPTGRRPRKLPKGSAEGAKASNVYEGTPQYDQRLDLITREIIECRGNVEICRIYAEKWGLSRDSIYGYISKALLRLAAAREKEPPEARRARAIARFEELLRAAMGSDVVLERLVEEGHALTPQLMALKLRELKVAGFAVDRLAKIDDVYEPVRIQIAGNVGIGGDSGRVRDRINELLAKRTGATNVDDE